MDGPLAAAGGEHVNTTSRTYAQATGEHREGACAELAGVYQAVTERRRAIRSILTDR
jgi:hypothetical protein